MTARQLLDVALAALYEPLTGDLAHPSDVVARDLDCWLDRHEYPAHYPATSRMESK